MVRMEHTTLLALMSVPYFHAHVKQSVSVCNPIVHTVPIVSSLIVGSLYCHHGACLHDVDNPPPLLHWG